MTNSNEADNKIDDHRSRKQDLSLKITETRAAPQKGDLNLPHRKVSELTPARTTTIIRKTSHTNTTGHTLTGPSRKTTDLRHSKRNEKLFGGNPNCTFQATDTTTTAQHVPQGTLQISFARICFMRKTSESTIPLPKGLQISSLGNTKTFLISPPILIGQKTTTTTTSTQLK
jgi:hypothetical protein